MSKGKAASQAAHLASTALIEFISRHPERIEEFRALGKSGSRILLRSKTSAHAMAAYEAAKDAGLCCATFFDEGHIHPPHFDGQPIFVGAAIGPCTREEARPFTKRFQCL
jgi:PTH2 family peptidyl-tRNA hydrolase